MREFSVPAYQRLGEAVRVPLLVAEASDGCHYNTASFINQVRCEFVRTGAHFRGGITGAVRTAHLAESFGIRADVHGGGLPNIHLCMAIPNTTFYEALVAGNPVHCDKAVDAEGYARAPEEPGIGFGVDRKALEAGAVAIVWL